MARHHGSIIGIPLLQLSHIPAEEDDDVGHARAAPSSVMARNRRPLVLAARAGWVHDGPSHSILRNREGIAALGREEGWWSICLRRSVG